VQMMFFLKKKIVLTDSAQSKPFILLGKKVMLFVYALPPTKDSYSPYGEKN